MLVLIYLFLIVLHITLSVCQYMADAGMRADMTFDEGNDRYDVTNIIQEQNRAFQEQPTDMEFDSRRNFIPLVQVLRNNRRNPNGKTQRRMNDFAYHDQMLDEQDNDDDGAYDRNLADFQTNNAGRNRQIIDLQLRSDARDVKNYRSKGPKKAETVKPLTRKGSHRVLLKYLPKGKEIQRREDIRRSLDTNPDNEVLLNYAVPLNMKVKGYLEIPQEP